MPIRVWTLFPICYVCIMYMYMGMGVCVCVWAWYDGLRNFAHTHTQSTCKRKPTSTTIRSKLGEQLNLSVAQIRARARARMHARTPN